MRVASPLGPLTLAARDGALIGLWLENQKNFAAGIDHAVEAPEAAPFSQAVGWLQAYFSGQAPASVDFPLKPAGTVFQRRVWHALLDIPWGETRTYGALARQLGSSARAVGAAVGCNPISIIIPCHRVVGADGSLTGYAGGLENKRKLLALEGALPPGGE